MLISMMKFRSSLTRLIGAGILAAACAAGAGLAQEVGDDVNARSPDLVIVPLGGDAGEAHFVVGQLAWGDALGLLNQIQSQTEITSADMVQRLWSARDETPPLFLFELARQTAQSDPEFAIEAYFLARSRTMYDASRCLDSSALDVINEASAYAGEAVVELIATYPEFTVGAIEAIIETGAAFAGTASPWWACSFGANAYFAAVNEQTLSGDEWLMVEGRWPSIREQISVNLQANLNVMRAAEAVAELED